MNRSNGLHPLRSTNGSTDYHHTNYVGENLAAGSCESNKQEEGPENNRKQTAGPDFWQGLSLEAKAQLFMIKYALSVAKDKKERNA